MKCRHNFKQVRPDPADESSARASNWHHQSDNVQSTAIARRIQEGGGLEHRAAGPAAFFSSGFAAASCVDFRQKN
jgi:hypothetical protein